MPIFEPYRREVRNFIEYARPILEGIPNLASNEKITESAKEQFLYSIGRLYTWAGALSMYRPFLPYQEQMAFDEIDSQIQRKKQQYEDTSINVGGGSSHKKKNTRRRRNKKRNTRRR